MMEKMMEKMMDLSRDTMRAGTGYMQTLTEGLGKMQKLGYIENFVPEFDHLSCRMGAKTLYPQDMTIDHMMRFENTSDPDDQSILYAISSKTQNLKGVYVESYGLYHDDLSKEMLKKISEQLS